MKQQIINIIQAPAMWQMIAIAAAGLLTQIMYVLSNWHRDKHGHDLTWRNYWAERRFKFGLSAMIAIVAVVLHKELFAVAAAAMAKVDLPAPPSLVLYIVCVFGPGILDWIGSRYSTRHDR